MGRKESNNKKKSWPGNWYFGTYSIVKQPRFGQPYLQPWPRGYKTFSMLNSAEQEIYPANKC